MHRIDSLIYTTKLSNQRKLNNIKEKNKGNPIQGENMSTDDTKSIPTPVEGLSNNRDYASSGLGSAPSLPPLGSTTSLTSLTFHEIPPRRLQQSSHLSDSLGVFSVSITDEEDSTSDYRQLYDLQKQIRRLESQLQQSRDDLKLKTSIIQLKDYKLESLKKLNAELQGEKASFINDFQDLIDENASFKASNDSRKQELKAALESSAAKDEQIEQLREELRLRSEQLADTNHELEQMYARTSEGEIAQITGDNDDTASELSNGASESSSNVSEPSSRASEPNNDVTYQTLVTTNAGSVKSRQKIEQLKDEIAEMKRKLDHDQTLKAELYENIRGLAVCLTNKEAELRQANATIASLQQSTQ